tara:strand:+ start:411 stop:578 length:168 start_codon:yes stop_codon:yes gene_type:complete
MKIIELFPKKSIEVEDDECLNCYAYIELTETFCSIECSQEWHEINKIDEHKPNNN